VHTATGTFIEFTTWHELNLSGVLRWTSDAVKAHV
jgi:hypothetical protein